MKLLIPDPSLVLLLGPSGSGKSTFARKHFLPSEALSSDYCRYLVSDDANDQAATSDAFELLHFIAGRRLARRKLTVVDATNVQPHARAPLIALAGTHQAPLVAIVFNLPVQICLNRNVTRTDRTLNRTMIEYQWQELQDSIKGLEREGFGAIYVLDEPGQVHDVVIERQTFRV